MDQSRFIINVKKESKNVIKLFGWDYTNGVRLLTCFEGYGGFKRVTELRVTNKQEKLVEQ